MHPLAPIALAVEARIGVGDAAAVVVAPYGSHGSDLQLGPVWRVRRFV